MLSEILTIWTMTSDNFESFDLKMNYETKMKYSLKK